MHEFMEVCLPAGTSDNITSRLISAVTHCGAKPGHKQRSLDIELEGSCCLIGYDVVYKPPCVRCEQHCSACLHQLVPASAGSAAQVVCAMPPEHLGALETCINDDGC